MVYPIPRSEFSMWAERRHPLRISLYAYTWSVKPWKQVAFAATNTWSSSAARINCTFVCVCIHSTLFASMAHYNAGADRLQTGMRGAFGKLQGTVARMHIGQPRSSYWGFALANSSSPVVKRSTSQRDGASSNTIVIVMRDNNRFGCNVKYRHKNGPWLLGKRPNVKCIYLIVFAKKKIIMNFFSKLRNSESKKLRRNKVHMIYFLIFLCVQFKILIQLNKREPSINTG